MADPTSCARELGMKRKSFKSRDWTKPEMRLLGKISDVAGAQTPISQAGNSKS